MWLRPLAGGDWAVLFFNNNLTQPQNITCGGSCWSGGAGIGMGWPSTAAVSVRDLWGHTDNGTVTGSLTVHGVAKDASVMVKLSAA